MQQIKRMFMLVLTIGFIFGFQSCKKDGEIQLTKTDYLTIQEGWTLESTDGNVDVITDALIALYFQILPPEMQTPEIEAELRSEFDLESLIELDECDKDNITIFKTNGDVIDDQGIIICEGASTTVDNTWAFGANETQLLITDKQDGETQTFTIKTLNESRLSIELRMSIAEEFDAQDLGELEGLVGYDNFITQDIVLTLTFKAN
ncbi:MAG: hypothetical protein R3E32_09435 [Chitinophagales bacterium]